MFGLMRCFVRQSLLLVGALMMLAVAAPRAWADSTSDANYAVQVDSPAVVRIVSAVDAQLICHGCLDGVDLVSPQTGAFQFFTSGSGVFISPDGYILTADHVVDHSINNPEDVSLIANAAVSDIAQRFGASQSTVMQFLQQHIDSIEIPMQVQSQQVFLSTAYTGQLQNTAQVTSYQVVRIVVNSPVSKQDVAIVKVEAQDMPYLQLATTSSVNVGDAVTAIAYPADADAVLNGGDFTSLLNPTQSDINTINSLLTASVNNGAVTAQKNLSDGTPIYETSGISAQGSSGGPVIDQQGQIIGFVDAGPPTDRLTFIIPSSVVVDYVRQAGIANPGSATFMSLWTKSMTAYYATGSCHWIHAYQDLTKLHNQYPQFGGIEPFLQNAQAKATPAECPAPAKPLAINRYSGLVLGMLSGSGVLLLALIGSIILLITRRRKRATQASVLVPGGPTPAAPSVPGGTPSFPPTGNGPISMPHLTVPLTPPANGSQPGSASPVPTGAAFSPPTMPVFTPTGPAISNPTANAPLSNGGPAGMGTSAMPPVSQPATHPATPGRRCLLGHMVSDATARFCPQCGTPVSSAPVQV